MLHALIAGARLATLACNGADGLPAISLLPMFLVPGEGAQGTLYGHLARANPQGTALRAAGRAVAVFRGPEAYVSPSWYPSKAETHRVVPTWNYEAVLASGAVEVFDDPARLLAVVTRLTEANEAGRAIPWAVADAPADFVAAQLKGIVGVAIRIEALTGKRKLSQNRATPDRDGAIAGLAGSEDARDRAAADAMARAARGD